MLLWDDVGDDVHDDGWVGLIVGHAFDEFLDCGCFFLESAVGHVSFEFF